MNNSINQTFGVLIKDHRDRLRMSQAELAGRLGCPQPTVSRLERGQRSANLLELLSLAKIMNIAVSDLFAELEVKLNRPKALSPMIPEKSATGTSPLFYVALSDENVAVSQLAA